MYNLSLIYVNKINNHQIFYIPHNNNLLYHIKAFQPESPLTIFIQSSLELVWLNEFLNMLSVQDSKIFLENTTTSLNFGFCTNGQNTADCNVDDGNDKNLDFLKDYVITSTRVEDLIKVDMNNLIFGKNTFPLITLFFIILSIAIYLFFKVIRYK